MRQIVMFVAVNEDGRKIGQTHHNCKVTDETVDKIRDLREDLGYSYDKLAKMFGLQKAHIQKICNYTRRAQTIDRWIKVIKYVED